MEVITIMSRMHIHVLTALVLATLHPATGICAAPHVAGVASRSTEFPLVLGGVDAWHRKPSDAVVPGEHRSVRKSLHCRFPGEFESQRALLLACNHLIDDLPDLFAEIVQHASGRVQIISLVSSVEQWEAAKELLRGRSVPSGHVSFVEMPHDTMWARDYGPIVVRSNAGRPILLDAGYDVGRTNDDRVPAELARLLDLPVVETSLRLDGGNLLSNGDGLAVTTFRLFDENAEDESHARGDIDYSTTREVLRRNYGLKHVVVLEPLAGEPTGHVDMFATFTCRDTVVVGRYDRETDPENAEILDRNAATLARIQTAHGPLRVVRIPMPPHDDDGWRTYTNVIYANGVLLVPTYANVDDEHRLQALRTYERLLPHWKVVGIEASRLIESDGALHCIAMNLGPLGPLPKFPRPRTRAADLPGYVADDSSSLSDPKYDFLPQSETRIPVAGSDGNDTPTATIRSLHWSRDQTAPSRLRMPVRARWTGPRRLMISDHSPRELHRIRFFPPDDD